MRYVLTASDLLKTKEIAGLAAERGFLPRRLSHYYGTFRSPFTSSDKKPAGASNCEKEYSLENKTFMKVARRPYY
jgi:hypothetical protein